MNHFDDGRQDGVIFQSRSHQPCSKPARTPGRSRALKIGTVVDELLHLETWESAAELFLEDPLGKANSAPRSIRTELTGCALGFGDFEQRSRRHPSSP